MDTPSTDWPPEIDQYTIKLLIGGVALALPVVEWLLCHDDSTFTSISSSYWQTPGGWPRNLFVGALFVIAGLLCGYNGTSLGQLVFGKVAAVAALVIATFPCRPPGTQETETIHVAAATVMFAVLGWFCIDFIRRARTKLHDERRTAAASRIGIYIACGIAMGVSILLFAIRKFGGGSDDLVFWGEAVGLGAFGVSWLTASHKLPVISAPSEKQPLSARRATVPR